MNSRNIKISFKCFRFALLLLLSVIIVSSSNVKNVFAYDYIKTGASKGGEASITEVRSKTGKNNYYTVGGYKVKYTITHDWLSFDGKSGGFFYAADKVLATQGCHFAYHTPGGEIWQNGAIILGKMVNPIKLAKVNPLNKTVSYEYTVGSKEDIPAYLAYVYEPASNAYVHITEERGKDAHVWYYHPIKDLTITKDTKIDVEAPKQEIYAYPEGNTVVIAGKIWAKEARIECLCIDEKSRPNTMKLYYEQNFYKEYNNAANQTTMKAKEIVAKNGQYGVKSVDQLGNCTAITNVRVDCIDKDLPQIGAIKIDKDTYAKTHCITVTANDTGCGLHEKAYRFNGGDWQSENFFVAKENGIIKVEVRDALENIKSSQYTMDKIDVTEPNIEVELVATGKQMNIEGLLYTNQMHAKVTAADMSSGIATLALMQKSKTGYDTLVKSSKEQQKDTIESNIDKENECYVYAEDAVQNKAQYELNLELLDTTPPEMSIDVSANNIVKSQNKKWTNEYQAKIKTTDIKSRPKTIYCRKDNRDYQKLQNKKFTKSMECDVSISQNGIYVFYAEDHLENVCNEYKIEISNIDRTAPTIVKNEYYLAKDNESIVWELEATDKQSGLDVKAFKFDDGDWQKDNKVVVIKEGEHQVQVRDSLGNTRQIEIVIQMPDEREGEDEKYVEPIEPMEPIDPIDPIEQLTKQPESPTKQPKLPTKKSQTPTVQPKTPIAQIDISRIQPTTKVEDKTPIKKVKENGSSLAKKQTIVKMQDKLANSNELKIEEKLKSTLSENDTKKLKSVKNSNKNTPVIIGVIVLIVLLSILLFALMYKYKNMCTLYSMYKNKKKNKITKIPIERKNDVWMIEINDTSIPNLSIGEYLIKPSRIFIAEQKEEYIFLMINGNAIKVPLEEEITFTL